jgi:transcriptional regulator with XRE-family HTH domain
LRYFQINFWEVIVVSIGERLKELREGRGYMQRDVADSLGVAPNTLSGYERDLRNPDSTILLKLADFYGVTVDYLLGKEEMKLSNIYLSLAKEAEENGIDPDDIKLALETIKRLRGGK